MNKLKLVEFYVWKERVILSILVPLSARVLREERETETTKQVVVMMENVIVVDGGDTVGEVSKRYIIDLTLGDDDDDDNDNDEAKKKDYGRRTMRPSTGRTGSGRRGVYKTRKTRQRRYPSIYDPCIGKHVWRIKTRSATRQAHTAMMVSVTKTTKRDRCSTQPPPPSSSAEDVQDHVPSLSAAGEDSYNCDDLTTREIVDDDDDDDDDDMQTCSMQRYPHVRASDNEARDEDSGNAPTPYNLRYSRRNRTSRIGSGRAGPSLRQRRFPSFYARAIASADSRQEDSHAGAASRPKDLQPLYVPRVTRSASEHFPSMSPACRRHLYVRRPMEPLRAADGSTIEGLALYSLTFLRAGSFIGLYAGGKYSENSIRRCTADRRKTIDEYSIDIPEEARKLFKHDFICPDFETSKSGRSKPDPRVFPLCYANEPREGTVANCVMNELFFLYDDLDDANSEIPEKEQDCKWGGLALYTCADIPPGTELTWYYGTDYARNYRPGRTGDLKPLFRVLERWSAVIDLVPMNAVYRVE